MFTPASPLPPAPLCFLFTAQRLQGFDHLRLINYDAQLSSGSVKSKERKVPFSLPPGDPFCLRASSFLEEQLCPISSCIPLVQSPLCAGAGLQPARAASTCLSLTGSGITGFSKTARIPRRGGHRARRLRCSRNALPHPTLQRVAPFPCLPAGQVVNVKSPGEAMKRGGCS